MLCPTCERPSIDPPATPYVALRDLWGAERLRLVLCERCGSLLSGEEASDRLLTRLVRLGLAGPVHPLLESSDERDGR